MKAQVMLSRRDSLRWPLALGLLPAASAVLLRPARAENTGFGFPDVIAKAKARAAAPYSDQSRLIQGPLANITYDAYRRIRFRPSKALWRGETPFEVQFFQPGFVYRRQVAINIVDQSGKPKPFVYRPDLFDFDGQNFGDALKGLTGFAGFRLHYPLMVPDYADEIAVFLGASYFRIIGREQVYGASARGITVDTASPGGEEFPAFTDFWLVKPGPDDNHIVVYALLDGPSLTGAYSFLIEPGNATVMRIRARLFTRKAIGKLGVAPLTSMFLYGENSDSHPNDYRPEVHDSDGLALHSAQGEWIWRPLVNRSNLQISSYANTAPRGFGLLQRDRNFADYQDLNAKYQKRPSLWVEPLSDWGKGRIELVEIPTDSEIHDNIVTYFVPKQPVTAGAQLSFDYRLSAFLTDPTVSPGGRCVATRIGAPAAGSNQPAPADARLFVIDFKGGDLTLLRSSQPVEAVVSASKGKLAAPTVMANTAAGGWRVLLHFDPAGATASDLRCFLRLQGHVLTETWSYLWTKA